MSTSWPLTDTKDKLSSTGFAGILATWTTRAIVYASFELSLYFIFTFTFKILLKTRLGKAYVRTVVSTSTISAAASSLVVYHTS